MYCTAQLLIVSIGAHECIFVSDNIDVIIIDLIATGSWPFMEFL